MWTILITNALGAFAIGTIFGITRQGIEWFPIFIVALVLFATFTVSDYTAGYFGHGSWVPDKRTSDLLSQFNPQNFTVEEVANILGGSNFMAKLVCNTGVRQGTFVKTETGYSLASK